MFKVCISDINHSKSGGDEKLKPAKTALPSSKKKLIHISRKLPLALQIEKCIAFTVFLNVFEGVW